MEARRLLPIAAFHGFGGEIFGRFEVVRDAFRNSSLVTPRLAGGANRVFEEHDVVGVFAVDRWRTFAERSKFLADLPSAVLENIQSQTTSSRHALSHAL